MRVCYTDMITRLPSFISPPNYLSLVDLFELITCSLASRQQLPV